MKQFVFDLETDGRVDANMWLSIYDTALRLKDDKLRDMAKQRFNLRFDFA